MPRLCPHCHHLGISVWKTLWSAAGPVECSHCHTILVRKQEWSRYVLLLLVPWFVITLIYRIPPDVSILIAVPLFMVGTYLHYRFAHFEPIPPPPEKTTCSSANGS